MENGKTVSSVGKVEVACIYPALVTGLIDLEHQVSEGAKERENTEKME